MSTLARRSFLKATSGAIGACAMGAPLSAAFAGEGQQDPGRAKIYTVFFRTAPSKDDTDLEPIIERGDHSASAERRAAVWTSWSGTSRRGPALRQC